MCINGKERSEKDRLEESNQARNFLDTAEIFPYASSRHIFTTSANFSITHHERMSSVDAFSGVCVERVLITCSSCMRSSFNRYSTFLSATSTKSGPIKASGENAVCVWVGVPAAGNARTGPRAFHERVRHAGAAGRGPVSPAGRAGAR